MTHTPKINYPLKVFFGDIWQYSQGYHRRLLLYYFAYTLTSLATLIPPVVVAHIVDELNSASFNYLVAVLGTLFIFDFIRSFLRNRLKFQIYRLAEKIKLQSRQAWISQLIDFDLKWHEQQSSGKKMSIITRAADQLRSLIQFLSRGGGGIDIITNVFGVMIIFVGLNPKYALISLVNIVAYIYILNRLNRQANIHRHHLNQITDRVIGKNYDFFSNVSLIKSLGITQSINRILFHKESKVVDKTIAVAKLDFNRWVSINTISQICYSFSLLLIVSDIIAGHISLGSFFIYTGYINRLQDGLTNIADWSNELIERYLGLYKLRQLLTSGTQATNSGHISFPNPLNHISITNLSFAYKNHASALKNLDLQLSSGLKYGFVGASGSGKSTLTKLLLKLYLPQSGQILYNHVPLSHLSTESLRRAIAVAPQDSEVFNLTFKENIIISSNSFKFNPELYHQAIAISECNSILDKINHKHHTLLGEKGIRLSGGERQRLGIARAIYKNSPIIIFDESTSSLDSKTEEKILQNIEIHLKAKTIIWVAHRLSTLRFTDQIIVFDQGCIVEQGSFSRLIKTRSTFYQLWQIQKKTRLHPQPVLTPSFAA
jgi:ABC-type multidrug transport system fused ATPase/permease subunit